ncbi:SNRPA [Cordylochernes scorpioides]|uniref:SNRPA n=1 Tax=Cordylochernes scorpioides TaxID=51811 RepID=A0ABY6K6N6_9ARAC|nr:SNRPA [Cordylochernes scorpioides]
MLELTPNHSIYINNLNEKVKIPELKTSLKAIFAQFGPIMDIYAHNSLKRRGQAFIAFTDIGSAANAMQSMQGFPFYGKPMRIQFAKGDSDCVSKMKGTYLERPKKPKPKPMENKKLKKKAAKEQARQTSQVLPQPMAAAPHYAPTAASGGANNISLEQPPNQILFVTNIPSETHEGMLLVLFQQFHGFREVRPVPGRHDIAFVEFETEAQAAGAKESLDGFKMSPTGSIKIYFAKK